MCWFSLFFFHVSLNWDPPTHTPTRIQTETFLPLSPFLSLRVVVFFNIFLLFLSCFLKFSYGVSAAAECYYLAVVGSSRALLVFTCTLEHARTHTRTYTCNQSEVPFDSIEEKIIMIPNLFITEDWYEKKNRFHYGKKLIMQQNITKMISCIRLNWYYNEIWQKMPFPSGRIRVD